MPINPLGYSCIKKLQRDNLWHAYNEPINFYSAPLICYRDSSEEQNSVEIIVDNGKNEIFETIIDGEEEETIRLEAKDIAELKVR